MYRTCNKIWHYFKIFSQQTTIHGFNIIGMPNLHWTERFFWTVIIALSAAGAISLTTSNWNRYSANPTVISIQKDYRNWENHLPAVTGCFNDKVDEKKAEKYIYEKWKSDVADSKYPFYVEFVRAIAYSSYNNFEDLEKFKNDSSLFDVDMVGLVSEVYPKVTGTLVTVDKSREFKWEIILIELGVCFTFFSKFSELLSIRVPDDDRNDTETSNSPLKCHYLNGLCYARFDSNPKLPLKYYVHSHLEIPDLSSKHYHSLGKGSDMEINYRVIETQASGDIKYLRPAQRNCRFDDEPLSSEAKAYTIKGKTCNVTGLLCLAKYKKQLLENPKSLGCKCPQTCNFINYLPEIPKLVVWETGAYFDQMTTFRWGLLHPTTKYRRDIIFGFGDLIVSIGGTLNLFLGISFMSIIEVFFLICENIIDSVLENTRVGKLKRKMKKTAPLKSHFFY
ncbi:unnamed protein product [Phyllotreta striolata]|uniref:Uncharacterized protein n=1 Tax=Phyllotreta striolata TaxID=444603 RepID=A0A9P0GRB4_PHYSR|nr:unnamed protein product [Phyllotreta striolata]